ncbi:hypothetical protein HPB47_002611 [Ixodes persulcatus]|uniref:Uncharacterized protein n=1 Tax=Ixodes persulcatus TaxID=34615 RepID=A0AC60PKT6_IXOPE|nr:hypothetical protein HPB47_002611 [Ixodes persulcatus]
MKTPLFAPPRLQLLQATQDHAAITSYETSPPPSQEMDEDAEDFGPSNNAKRFRSSGDSLKDADKSLQASWASREPDATDFGGTLGKGYNENPAPSATEGIGPTPTHHRPQGTCNSRQPCNHDTAHRTMRRIGLRPRRAEDRYQLLCRPRISSVWVCYLRDRDHHSRCERTRFPRTASPGVISMTANPMNPRLSFWRRCTPTEWIDLSCARTVPARDIKPPAARLTSGSAATAENNTSNARKPAQMARPCTAVIVNRMVNSIRSARETKGRSRTRKMARSSSRKRRQRSKQPSDTTNSRPGSKDTTSPLRRPSKVQIQDTLHSYADITAKGLKGSYSPNARRMLVTFQVEQDRDQANFDSTVKRLEQQLKEIQCTMERVKCKHNQRQKSRAGRLRALHFEIEEG